MQVEWTWWSDWNIGGIKRLREENIMVGIGGTEKRKYCDVKPNSELENAFLLLFRPVIKS